MPSMWDSPLGQGIINKLEGAITYCWNNGKKESFRLVTGKYRSHQVPEFITRIVYPPTQDREYSLSVYIHYIEYLINRKISRENLEVKTLDQYRRVYEEILRENKIHSECDRFFENFLRREDFKNGREKGIIGKFKDSKVPFGNN